MIDRSRAILSAFVVVVLLMFLIEGDVHAGGGSFSYTHPDSAGKNDISHGNHKWRYYGYGLALAGGGLAFAADKEANRFMTRRKLHGEFGDKFFDKVEDLGTETPYIVAVPAFAIYGVLAKNDRGLRTGGELAVGLLSAQAVTQLVKRGFGRKRPYETNSTYDFFDGGTSFYSGHTISAFTFATVVSKNYPRQNLGFMGIDRTIPLVPIVAYTAASMVAVQRLYANVHWSSDVYFGALAGYCVGSLAVHFGNKLHIYSVGISPGGTKAFTVVFRI